MKRQQRKAIWAIAILAGALASVFVPLLMDRSGVTSQQAWSVLAPGTLIFPVIHMPLAGLIMILAFDGILYMGVFSVIAACNLVESS
jgi:hypothetical protein